MDKNVLKKHLHEAVREIQRLIGKTEEIYGAVYEQLPRFEQEIELTLDETAILLEYFIPHEGGALHPEHNNGHGDILKLAQVLRNVEENFIRNSQELVDEHDLRQSVSYFLGDGQSEQDGINTLLEMMEQVKERITEIEIVSLNAIIHAARLGDAGRAFGVISHNINILSNQLSEDHVQLQVFAENLGEWNGQFVDGLQEMLKCHNDLTTRQREDLKQLIELTFASLGKINALLQDLIGHVKNIVQPVKGIMVSIQAQDIIRQNMENLNKCLETLIDSINNHTADGNSDSFAGLELLNFVSGALELALKLVDNIENELAGSLLELEGQLADMSIRLAELEDEGSMLAGFLGGRAGDESEDDLVRTIFLKVQAFMDSFSLGLTTLQERIDGFAGTNDRFYSCINGLDGKMGIIRDHIGFLQKLGLVTRIELARIGTEGDSFAQEITVITDRVVTDVNINEEMIGALKNKLQRELLQFEEMLGKNRGKAGTMLHIAVETRANLEKIEKLISRAVQTLGLSCGNLMDAVKRARTSLEKGRQLPAKMQEVKACLQALDADVTIFHAQCLAAAGLETWDGTSRELQDMLGSLTTYLERVSAREVLADDDLDIGSESGELTLF